MTTTNENKNYRMLEVGEVIEEGDEVVRGEKWQKVSISVGAHVSVFSAYCYRRLIPTPPLLLEVGKYYKTRGGDKVRVLAVDGKFVYCGSPQPIVGEVYRTLDTELVTYSTEGRFYTNDENHLDLLSPWVEVPEVGEGWRLVGSTEVVQNSDEICHLKENGQVDENWHTRHSWQTFLVKQAQENNKPLLTYFRRRISPVVAWDKMPAWARWAGRDENGKWYWFVDKPKMCLHADRDISANSWDSHDIDCGGFRAGEIPIAFYPTFSGDWKDSLVERKEGE